MELLRKNWQWVASIVLCIFVSLFGHYLSEDVYYHVKSGVFKFKVVAKYGEFEQAKIKPLDGYIPQDGYKKCIAQYNDCNIGDTIAIYVPDAITPAQYRSKWAGDTLFYLGIFAGVVVFVLFCISYD